MVQIAPLLAALVDEKRFSGFQTGVQNAPFLVETSGVQAQAQMNSLLYSIQVVLADAAADALQPLFLALALKISYQATYHSLRSRFRSSLKRHARPGFVMALA
jgi:hypothetical protein